MGTTELTLANADGHQLLRHRDDGVWRTPVRLFAIWLGAIQLFASSGRPDDSCRNGNLQDELGC
ncbi:MAG: hypothetical protein UZ06_CHB003001640 [Chlorobi bacterium OLB6]|nr:MAG: hypothetical protein UZ06_CHB003001640 [Chlorobi bacterium OLB6]